MGINSNKTFSFIKIILLSGFVFGVIFIIKAVMDKNNEQYANLREKTDITESLRNMQNWQPVEGIVLAHSSIEKQTFHLQMKNSVIPRTFGGEHTFYFAHKQKGNWVMNTENFTFLSDSPRNAIDFIEKSAGEIQNIQNKTAADLHSRIQSIGKLYEAKKSDKCVEIDDFKRYMHTVNSEHSNERKTSSPFYNLDPLNSDQIQQAIDIRLSCNGYEKVIVWINPENPTDVSILRVDRYVRDRNIKAEAIRNKNRHS